MLSPALLKLLRDWYRIARPQGWLFPGQDPINPLTTRQLTRADPRFWTILNSIYARARRRPCVIMFGFSRQSGSAAFMVGLLVAGQAVGALGRMSSWRSIVGAICA